jgi:hypothetical protein
MNKILFVFALFFSQLLSAQVMEKVINPEEVGRIEKILSSDSFQGRKVYTEGLNKAAVFIADEFNASGLKPVSGVSYFQEFQVVRCKFLRAGGTLNGSAVESRNIVALSTQPSLRVDPSSGYEWFRIGPADTPFNVIRRLQESGKNYLVTIDTIHRNFLNRLKSFRREQFPGKNSLLCVLTDQVPVQYQLEFEQEVTPLSLKNVVGVLPGRKRPEEYVIYSGHYDHLGIGKPDKEGDSIFNGANDDAAGTTAVLMLARYFAQQKDNERTLIFAAFTAEEVGGYGSQYFSRQYDPNKVVAMFNIEMIGTESKWGPDAAYITGYERSNMGKILQKNLTGTPFRFYPDPYTTQNLFYRSDNATLARLGVPAHTISTSRMEPDPQAAVKEVDKYYHTLNDEMETLDMKNMAAIIRAIALSSFSIVNGMDTPSRVDPATVR